MTMLQERACSALSNLACGEPAKSEIARSGAVPILIALTKVETLDCCTEEAVRCLRNLSYSNDHNQRLGPLSFPANFCIDALHLRGIEWMTWFSLPI